MPLDPLEILKLFFIGLATFFGIYGTFAETHNPKQQAELDSEGWIGRVSAPKSGWQALSKKARISLISLSIGFLGTLATTYLSQKEDAKAKDEREEQRKLDEARVLSSIEKLDRISDRLTYPLDSADLEVTLMYSLSDLDLIVRQELWDFFAEYGHEQDAGVSAPISSRADSMLLPKYPHILERFVDHGYALVISDRSNGYGFFDDDMVVRLEDNMFWDWQVSTMKLNGDTLRLFLVTRPSIWYGSESIRVGSSARSFAGRYVFFGAGEKHDPDLPDYPFSVEHGLVKLKSTYNNWYIELNMEPVTKPDPSFEHYSVLYGTKMPPELEDYLKIY